MLSTRTLSLPVPTHPTSGSFLLTSTGTLTLGSSEVSGSSARSTPISKSQRVCLMFSGLSLAFIDSHFAEPIRTSDGTIRGTFVVVDVTFPECTCRRRKKWCSRGSRNLESGEYSEFRCEARDCCVGNFNVDEEPLLRGQQRKANSVVH